MRLRTLLFCLLLAIAPAATAQVNISINLSLFPELVQVPGYPVYYAPRQDQKSSRSPAVDALSAGFRLCAAPRMARWKACECTVVSAGSSRVRPSGDSDSIEGAR